MRSDEQPYYGHEGGAARNGGFDPARCGQIIMRADTVASDDWVFRIPEAGPDGRLKQIHEVSVPEALRSGMTIEQLRRLQDAVHQEQHHRAMGTLPGEERL